MANEFDSLLPGNNPKIPSNLNIDNSPFSDLLPQEEKVKYKLSTDGNLSDKLSDKDLSDGNQFDSLLPNYSEEEDIDGDPEIWNKVPFATQLGFTNTWRVGKH